MGNFLSSIGNFFKNLFKKMTFKDWIIVLLCVLCLVFFLFNRHYKNELLTQKVVYNDSITTYKNKLGEEYKAKTVYVQTIKDLKTNNAELYKEVQSLKDNPLVVVKETMKVKMDTVVMESDTIIVERKTVVDDEGKETTEGVHELYWHKSNDYYKIEGNTVVKNDFSSFTTSLTNMEMPVELYTDIIEKDKNIQIITKTNNPYVSIINTEGVVLDPSKSKVLKQYFKQKRWGIGPHVGVGLTSDLKIRPYIGIGIQYNVFSF